MRYYKSKGLISTVRRMFQKIREFIFRKPSLFYYIDLADIKDEEHDLPDDMIVECHKSESSISREDLQVFFEFFGEKDMKNRLKGRFSLGAYLWLLKVGGTLAGYVWSIQGKSIGSQYFPLTDKDVNTIDNLIFEQFRGRGLNSVLWNYMLLELKKESMIRVFGDINPTNTSSIRSVEKHGFRKYARARKFRVGKRNFVIWSKC